MLKTLIVLPNGSEISSGPGETISITRASHTGKANDKEDLSIGSACADALEISLLAAEDVPLTAGDEITLYKVDGEARTKKGVYIVEKPTQATAYTVKLTAYDRVIKLDKDLTEWISSLTEWPYKLIDFAHMVCDVCGLTLVTENIPNGDFLVNKFTKTGATGRKLMRWIGEACCRFTKANADGNIELAWYSPSGVTLAPSGDNYYFQGSFSKEKYTVAPIEAVQICFANTEAGYLWPAAEEGANSYVISDNPLLSSTSDEVAIALQNILTELSGVTYTPCKVSVLSSYGIKAGQMVQITGKDGSVVTAYVMSAITKGQRTTLECTGNHRRDSAGAMNNKTQTEAAQDAVRNETPKQMFDRLTSGSKKQGLFYEDGMIFLNGMFIKAKTFTAEAETFIEPGMEEYETIKAHVLGSVSIPDDRIALYDFNNDGSVTVTDMIACKSAVLGKASLAGWSGAVKTPVTVTIDVTDPNKAILMTGTNMWGRSVELWYGLDGSNNGKFHGDVFVSGALMVGDEKVQFGEDASGNPLIGIGGEVKAVSWKDNGDGTYSIVGQ